MITGEFNFNIKDAMQNKLPQYNRAYYITNEPIRYWMRIVPPVKGRRVLTVAASGDQPLFYAANGAAQVDTFDITINACAVMDFKTTAIKTLSCSEYIRVVNNLSMLHMVHNAPSCFKLFFDTLKNMPDRTHNLIKKSIKHRRDAFSLGQFNETLKNPVDDKIYARLQYRMPGPFNFVWADLVNVHKYINDKYDVINLSNIFDHYLLVATGKTTEDIKSTLNNLWQYLNVGGYIFITTGCNQVMETIRTLPNAVIGETEPLTPNGWHPVIIQKTR